MNLSTSASSHVRLRMSVCVVRRPPQLPVSLANNAAITWTSSRSLLVAAKRTMRHELSSQQRVGAPGDIMRPYATAHLFNRCRNVSVYSFGLWLGTTRNLRCLSCAVYFFSSGHRVCRDQALKSIGARRGCYKRLLFIIFKNKMSFKMILNFFPVFC